MAVYAPPKPPPRITIRTQAPQYTAYPELVEGRSQVRRCWRVRAWITIRRMIPTLEPAVAVAAAEDRHWNPATRVIFRLAFVYFGLYTITTQMLAALNVVPYWVHISPLEQLPPTSNIVTWTARHVFHVTAPLV